MFMQHYSNFTLVIGDAKITMTPTQAYFWNAEDIIYPCDVDGWHFNPELIP